MTAPILCPYCAIQGHKREFGGDGCTHTKEGRRSEPKPGFRRVQLIPQLQCGHCLTGLTWDNNDDLNTNSTFLRAVCLNCHYKVAVPLQVVDLPAEELTGPIAVAGSGRRGRG